MIHLELPSKIPADKFMMPIAGWYAGDEPAHVISVKVGRQSWICNLEIRDDVKASYPQKACSGFRGILDFLNMQPDLQVDHGLIKLTIVVNDCETRDFTVAVRPSWEEDRERMRLAGAVTAEQVGLGLHSGDRQYRAYVGRPEEYDLSAAGAFQLLVLLGLRQYHRVLDVGCGSLRCGRLIIPYLNSGNYLGVEPNQWLVEQGVARELGEGIYAAKRPAFLYTDSPAALDSAPCASFALANSIFSHTSLSQFDEWLKHLAANLCLSGVLVATYLEGPEDYQGKEWVYPGCVYFRRTTIETLAARHGLRFRPLDWRHLHGQKWAVFARPAYDLDAHLNIPLAWNSVMANIGD